MRPEPDRASKRRAGHGCRWFRPAGRARRSERACPGSESPGPIRSTVADMRTPPRRTRSDAMKGSLCLRPRANHLLEGERHYFLFALVGNARLKRDKATIRTRPRDLRFGNASEHGECIAGAHGFQELDFYSWSSAAAAVEKHGAHHAAPHRGERVNTRRNQSSERRRSRGDRVDMKRLRIVRAGEVDDLFFGESHRLAEKLIADAVVLEPLDFCATSAHRRCSLFDASSSRLLGCHLG